MNKLLIAGLLGGGLVLFSGDKKKSTTKKIPSLKIYISEDSGSICHMKTKADLNLGVAIAQNRQEYDKFLSKNQDATIFDVARYRLDQFDRYKILPDVIDASVSPAVKFLYVLNILAAAFYMTSIGKMSQSMLASWMYDEKGLVDVLLNLEIMSYGDWYEDDISKRANLLTDTEAVEVIQQQLMLAPQLKDIDTNVLATLLTIMFATIITSSPEIDCTKIEKFIIADYTGWGEKGINPVIHDVYNKFYNIFLGIKKGE